jgi:hypothetical protein
MEVLIMLVMGAVNVLCFVVGAKVGQAVSKGETVKMPSVNPLQAVREHNEKKQAEMDQDKLDTIIRNIECYDGTGRGQEDVG